ncbi:hypothetical protein [Novosphingobium capsulatum]|uniref:hypothetical protein n=1 Tax=Novosphingobium capsulatum TaxID=13688 RepID=UPI00078965F1|nr:hypothetical protein [Novosphingobium capsulatum]WQD91260.1 hypothetical protein U0041_09510 [Novosphingobium capsulatum]
MTLPLGRRAFLATTGAAMAAASTSALAKAAPPTPGLLLLTDAPAAQAWLQSLASAFAQQAGSPAEIVVATQPETMMTLIADRLARPRGAFLSLLASSSHLLVQVALRDSGAHQYLELERAADLLQAPQAALPLHRALGFAPQLPTPATLAGRSLLAGAMEISR